MPGLYAWLRGHPRLVDGALALLLIAISVPFSVSKADQLPLRGLPFIAGMALALGATAFGPGINNYAVITAMLVIGSGIGLTSVAQIVNQHGGRVAITSQVGSGTRVTIWLPVQQPEAAEADQ